jgi:hypothetical protein
MGSAWLQLCDAQKHGGPAHAYRLRVGHPRPDVELRVLPSCLNLRPGETAVLTVCALRKDGFEGAVDLRLRDAPGFELHGARVPYGRDQVRVTLRAPGKALEEPVGIALEGRARIAGRKVRRPAVPADDRMQAFIYRHMVPAAELLVSSVAASRPRSRRELVSPTPVELPVGGTATLRFRGAWKPRDDEIELEMIDPPAGVGVHELKVRPNEALVTLSVDAEEAEQGLEGNLILECFLEKILEPKEGRPTARTRRVSLGLLPAVPFEIVEDQSESGGPR